MQRMCLAIYFFFCLWGFVFFLTGEAVRVVRVTLGTGAGNRWRHHRKLAEFSSVCLEKTNLQGLKQAWVKTVEISPGEANKSKSTKIKKKKKRRESGEPGDKDTGKAWVMVSWATGQAGNEGEHTDLKTGWGRLGAWSRTRHSRGELSR